MSNYVPALEDVRYEVPGRQLGWRVSQLQAQGYTYQVLRLPGGVYLVIVAQAPDADPFAVPVQHKRRRPHIDTAQVARWALVLTVVGVLAWTVYSVFAGVGEWDSKAAQTGTQNAIDGAWDWFSGLEIPGESEPARPVTKLEPAPWWRIWDTEPDTVTVQPQAQDSDWTWPPKNPAGDAIDSATQVITWLVYALIGVAALWVVVFVLGMARKVRGK